MNAASAELLLMLEQLDWPVECLFGAFSERTL